MKPYQHLHFEWVEPTPRRPVGYFEYFVNFQSLPAMIAAHLGDPEESRFDDCMGVIVGDGDPLDEAHLQRLLGMSMESPEIQAILASLFPRDFYHNLVFEEKWTPIYAAVCCGDIGCGGMVVRIEENEGMVKWVFGEPEWMPPLVFEAGEYRNAFADLRQQIARRNGIQIPK